MEPPNNAPGPGHDKFYWAFISYSRKDEKVAARLHRAIELYRIPRELRGTLGRDGPTPARIFPVFRDRDELPLASDIGFSIKDALAASRYLIVICSPHSARSRWVNEEVRMFKAMGREDRILAVMLAGKPKAALKGFAEEEECFCPALAHQVDADGAVTEVPAEPIAGDLREGGESWSVVLMRCLAGITGAGYDAFVRRERVRQRRRMQMAGAGALLLALASLGLWDHNRLKVSHHANLIERWGIPEGVRSLSEEEFTRRSDHYLLEKRQGKLRRVVHLNGRGTPVPEQDDFKWTTLLPNYDEHGVLTMIEYRNQSDQVILQRQFRPRIEGNGVVSQDVAFTRGKEHGLLPLSAQDASERQTRPYSPSDQKVRAEITTHRLVYNKDGLVAELHYLDPYNSPTPDSDGIYGKRMRYEASEIAVEIENLDRLSRPVANRHGIFSILQTSNTWGELETITRLNADKHPVGLSDGYASLRRTFDRNGNFTRLDFFGVDGKAVLHSDGLASVTMQRDDWGNQIEWRNLDREGRLVRNRVGVALSRSKFQASGFESEIRFFDEFDHPVIHADGIAAILYDYDAVGNPTYREYRDINDERISNVDGYCICRLEHDPNGKVIRESYFGTDGKPVMHRDGISIIESDYDPRGNRLEIRNYGTSARPALNVGRYFRMKSVFDRVGNETETLFFGVNSERVTHSDGISRIVRRFDSQGRLEEYSVFDPQDQPCNDRFGVFRVTNEYQPDTWAPRKSTRYDKDGRRLD